jgi:hypothetical protein
MQTKFYKLTVITLGVFLITGVSIMGWAITFHYDNTEIANDSQKELNIETLVSNIMPVETGHRKTILSLVLIGLIGLIGIRRPGKKLEILKKINQPDSKERKNFLYENNL